MVSLENIEEDYLKDMPDRVMVRDKTTKTSLDGPSFPSKHVGAEGLE